MTTILTTTITLTVIALSNSAYAQSQRQTIPEAIAEGAVSSVATTPSGSAPTVRSLLSETDLIVTGTIVSSRSYLSDDQRDVYTDHVIGNVVLVHQSKSAVGVKPGIVPQVTVTQLGGTVTVNGIRFTQKETALLPLQVGTNALFLLHRDGERYMIVSKYYGVFKITNDRMMPLAARDDFAPEYRNEMLSVALDRITRTVGSPNK